VRTARVPLRRLLAREEVAHQLSDFGLVLDDEHERASSVRDGVHRHSVSHARRRGR
jgi:hypothetical protein